jgi:hypothetical protein
MVSITLPSWVQKGAIVAHHPSYTLFPVWHVQARSELVYLLDAPKGFESIAYPLAECRAAIATDFDGVALMTVGGKPVTVIRQGSLYVLSNGKTKLGVRLQDELSHIAQNFAEFFGGEVVREEVSF